VSDRKMHLINRKVVLNFSERTCQNGLRRQINRCVDRRALKAAAEIFIENDSRTEKIFGGFCFHILSIFLEEHNISNSSEKTNIKQMNLLL